MGYSKLRLALVPESWFVMAKYKITVPLSAGDGNAFAIMGAVKSALKKAGATPEELTEYMNDSMSGDYDHLLRVACQWVEVR
jgi:hypothetical protein